MTEPQKHAKEQFCLVNIDSDYGFVPSGNEPSPETMIGYIYVTILCHHGTMC